VSFRRVRCSTDLQRVSVRRRRWATATGQLAACRRYLWWHRPLWAWHAARWRRGATRRDQLARIAWLKRTAHIRAAGWLFDGGSYPISGPQR